jgi:hypothetical protein
MTADNSFARSPGCKTLFLCNVRNFVDRPLPLVAGTFQEGPKNVLSIPKKLDEMIRVKWHHFYICELDFVHLRVTAGIDVLDFPGSLVNLPHNSAMKVSADPLKLPTVLI